MELLATLVRRAELGAAEAGRKIVVDPRLASLVEVALARSPETRRRRITVDVADRVVTLERVTEPERAKKIVREAPGVKEVKIAQVEIPQPVGM